MDHLPAPLDPARTLQDHPDLLLGLPRWQRVYLSERAAGNDERTAANAARCSCQTFRDLYLASQVGEDGGAFARGYDAIIKGVYVAGGPAAVRARHLESADAILDRVEKMALGQLTDATGAPERVRHRDQLGAVGHYLAAVQLTGSQPAPAPDGKAIAEAFFDKLRALRDAASSDTAPAPAPPPVAQELRQLPAPAPDTDAEATKGRG